MDLKKFTNGIERHNNTIACSIQLSGLHVVYEGSYSYTVGMRAIGYPELVVYGFDHNDAEVMLRGIHGFIKDGSFNPGEKWQDLPTNEVKSTFFACRTYYGDWRFSAQKLKAQ